MAAMMAGAPQPGSVACSDPSGQALTVLASPELPESLAATSTALYYAESEGLYEIPSGKPPSLLYSAIKDRVSVSDLASDDRELFVALTPTSSEGNGTLMRLAENERTLRPVTALGTGAMQLAVDGEAIYFSDMLGRKVSRIAR